MKKGLCIYHKDCNDGFASALAVWMKYGDDWDYLPMQYGDVNDLTDLTGSGIHIHDYENVMIVDFSLPRVTMENLAIITNLLVIDHHKTAQTACEGLDFCKFDLNKAGCTATWEHIHGERGIDCPPLLKHIADRDLWKFELPDTKAVCAGIGIIEKDFKQWLSLIVTEGAMDNLKQAGKILLKSQDKAVKDFVDRWRENPKYAILPDLADVVKVPIANCCDLISERIGALSQGHAFAIGYFETHEKRVFSLRTRRDDVDCGLIAKQFGGGGHPGAAGFSFEIDTEIDLRDCSIAYPDPVIV